MCQNEQCYSCTTPPFDVIVHAPSGPPTHDVCRPCPCALHAKRNKAGKGVAGRACSALAPGLNQWKLLREQKRQREREKGAGSEVAKTCMRYY